MRCRTYNTNMVTPLNISIAPAYSVQRISLVSSTPVRRYTSFSMGRMIGSRKVLSRLKTRVMNEPSGFVSASTTSRKSRIWNQPLFVIVRIFPDAASRTLDRQANPHTPPAIRPYQTFSLPQCVAEFHVQNRQHKKDQCRDGKNRVQHRRPSFLTPGASYLASRAHALLILWTNL